MKRYFPIYILTLVFCLSGCGPTTKSSNLPSLGGNAPYTGRIPSPSNYQATSAINASTMLPPVPE